MKNIIIFFAILISPLTTIAQGTTDKSDLRIKVDSIIEHQLKPQAIDSAFAKGQISNCNNPDTTYRPLIYSRSSIPNTTMPIILFDKKIIDDLTELNNYHLKNVELHIYIANDGLTALYGSRGENGAIFIVSKKKARRKHKRLRKEITSSQ